MRDIKRKYLERAGHTIYLLALVVLTTWALTIWTGGDANAAAADASPADIIVDEIGPEWTRTLPDPEGLTEGGAARLFSSDDATLQLLANPRLDCVTGVTGQSHGLALLRSLGFEELPADGSGVAKFAAGDGGGGSGLAAMFTTNRFTFVVFVLANDPAVALDPIADAVVELQAARDGGVVIGASQAASRLDNIILDSPPVPGLGNQLDYTADTFACEQGP